MSRIYVGNVNPNATERDLEDEFRVFGVLRSVWVARKPPGFAFVEYDDPRDADDAVRRLDGKNGWRVEHSRSGGRGGGRDGGGGGGGRGPPSETSRCYECGEPGHFARECRIRLEGRGRDSRDHRDGGGRDGGRDGHRGRSPSPRGHARRSPSYGRDRSPPPRRARSPSPPPRRARRSPSPVARNGGGRSRSRSMD